MPAHRVPPLTVDEIIRTALALTAERGLDELAMRACRRELGVTPMSLYHHVGDKDALTGLVADAVVAGVPTPARDLPWDVWLGEYHDALWKRLRGYPGVARYLLEHPSHPGRCGDSPRHRDVFVEGGFNDRDALLATSTFHTHLLGRLAVEALPQRDGGDDEPSWRSQGLTASDYTTHGLRTIIEGLRVLHQPTPTPGGRVRPPTNTRSVTPFATAAYPSDLVDHRLDVLGDRRVDELDEEAQRVERVEVHDPVGAVGSDQVADLEARLHAARTLRRIIGGVADVNTPSPRESRNSRAGPAPRPGSTSSTIRSPHLPKALRLAIVPVHSRCRAG